MFLIMFLIMMLIMFLITFSDNVSDHVSDNVSGHDVDNVTVEILEQGTIGVSMKRHGIHLF